jgi:hypothetical protein
MAPGDSMPLLRSSWLLRRPWGLVRPPAVCVAAQDSTHGVQCKCVWEMGRRVRGSKYKQCESKLATGGVQDRWVRQSGKNNSKHMLCSTCNVCHLSTSIYSAAQSPITPVTRVCHYSQGLVLRLGTTLASSPLMIWL